MGLKAGLQILQQAATKQTFKPKCLGNVTSPATLFPNQLKTLGLDSFNSVAKKGRNTSEQIQHLASKCEMKDIQYLVQKENRLGYDYFGAKLYTTKGSDTKWLVKDGELFYSPDLAEEKNAHDLFDELYSKITGQKRFPTCNAKFGNVYDQNNTLRMYKYIEQDANIADYPNLIKEGLGLDILLSTPISSKSIIISNGKAIRIKNGLTQYVSKNYSGVPVIPKSLITADIKISELFESGTESYKILENLNEKELISSLKKLDNLSDDDLVHLISGRGTAQYKRIREQLLKRKEYLKEYTRQMQLHPKKGPELMSEYLERIEGYIKPYSCEVTAPINDFLKRTEPDSKLLQIEENWKSYNKIAQQKFINKASDLIEDGTFTHNANLDNLESILDTGGLVTGQATIGKIIMGSDAGGNCTSSPAMLDTFIVKGNQSIKEYFDLSKRHSYEVGFIKNSDICFIIDKNRATSLSKNYNPRPDQRCLDTHWVFPFGTPINTVDRIVVNPNLKPAEVDKVINAIKTRGLDIKIYNRNGEILWEPVKELVVGFSQYGKKGVPLQYPRAEFRNDVWKMIAREVPVNERTAFLAKFNLTAGLNGVLDGVPLIKGVVPQTNAEKQMVALIEKFYQNKVNMFSEPAIQKEVNQILKEHPEFAMMIGKAQHTTHNYSIDIHTLELLKKAMNNSSYIALSDEGKEILKHVAIMHDYGKIGGVVTPGHAKLSRAYAEKVLASNDNIPQDVKNRILNLIENHHWFEAYNKGHMSPDEFAKIFPTWEDREIAMILAKADFETVNPTFHLKRLIDGKILTQEQYEKSFEAMMNGLIKSCPNP